MGFVSDLLGGSAQADAATQAANTQAASSANQVAEQRRQFDYIKQLLSPFVNAGTSALSGQSDLIGLNGNGAQQSAINNIQNGSQFQTMLQQGEKSILQNASATGGLRGGNTQAALSQYSPQLLNQFIQQQYANLGGLSSMGQNAAAGVGNAGQASTNAINSINQNATNAQTGAIIANGNTQANTVNQLLGIGGTLAGAGAFKGLGAGIASLFSDERLKSNIKRIGTHKKGFGIYEYIKFGKREVGVLAQEVEEIIPQAVIIKNGYKSVNYSMLEHA